MDLYKPICKHVVVPLWAKWEGSPYLKYLKYLMESQYYSEEMIREIQFGKIKIILEHAYKNCKYYKSKFDQEGIHPSDIKSFDDYLNVPILDKEAVRTIPDDLTAPNVDKYTQMLTSGSTGKPLKAWRNKDSQEFKRACGVRSTFWSGYDFGDRVYWLYGSPEKELKGIKKAKSLIRRKLLKRSELLDLLTLSEKSMMIFADKMRKKSPTLIWGHAHALYTFAKFLEKERITDIRPKGIYSAGMVLHDFERKKVEDVFQCIFQDRYGCEELGLIACECKEKNGLHINTDALYVEFIGTDGKHVAAGDRGNAIITDLTNFAMPFIRYKIEDVCIPSDKKCSCGRTQPLIEKIEGRVADFMLTPAGELISGISLTDHFAGHIPGITQMQIVQEKMDLLTLNIVRNERFGEDSKEKISHLVKDFFGEQMRFQYEFMEEIPKGPTGKYRFTICKVDHELF